MEILERDELIPIFLEKICRFPVPYLPEAKVLNNVVIGIGNVPKMRPFDVAVESDEILFCVVRGIFIVKLNPKAHCYV